MVASSSTAPVARKPKSKPRKAAAVRHTSHKAGTIRYRDDSGNSWTGMGPKPRWLRAAIEAGKKLEDFAA